MWPDCFKFHLLFWDTTFKKEPYVMCVSLKYLTRIFFKMFSRPCDDAPGTSIGLLSTNQRYDGAMEFSPALHQTLLAVGMDFILHVLLQVALKDIRTCENFLI